MRSKSIDWGKGDTVALEVGGSESSDGPSRAIRWDWQEELTLFAFEIEPYPYKRLFVESGDMPSEELPTIEQGATHCVR